MSATKELNFFVRHRNWSRGAQWYESQFPNDAKVRGESSPSYALHPVLTGVPERMAKIIPDARLIYLVRDPIERLLSHYRFARWVDRSEDRSFDEAIADLEASHYVAASRYGMQLERYLEHFPVSRILVIDRADLATNRADTLAQVFRFLAVDDGFTTPAFAHEHNPTDGLHANVVGGLAIRLLDTAFGGGRSAAIRSGTPRALIRPLLRSPRAQPIELESALHEDLIAYFKPDSDRLRALTDNAFADWPT